MGLELRRLVLVKRYLWGSLIVAVVPLVLLASLYDRYSTDLLNNLLTEQVDGELEAATVKMSGFINTHAKRLENIVDLPEVGNTFIIPPNYPLPDQLSDLLYLEVESPDIYGVEFFNVGGNRIRSIPAPLSGVALPDYSFLPISKIRDVEIIGPVLPMNGRPGWFLLRKSVFRNGFKIGALALKMRLSSLTELASSLYRPNVHEPRIVVDEKTAISVVGTLGKLSSEFSSSREFVPGWKISLVKSGKGIGDPREQIRYALLVVVVLSGIGVVWLFVHMSERLAKMIVPLSEGARSISKGNFSVRVSEECPGELKSLAQSFNEMSMQLDSMVKSRVDVDRRAALGKLAAGIAHEIRNPLSTVRTSIHGLGLTENDPERAELFNVVSSEVMRIDDLVEEFLSYARPRESQKEKTSVSEIFNSVKALMSRTALETQVNMHFDSDESLMLFVDPGQFRQVLMNLVLNSVQAMPDGGSLYLLSHDKGEFVEIVVKDTGTGIDKDDLSKVKAPFFTTKSRGTGLGLSICTQLIRVNGGSLDIDSVVGDGTTITMQIPKASAELSNE